MTSSKTTNRNTISTLHRSELLSVEEIVCRDPVPRSRAAGFIERFHVMLPLSGSLIYEEGSKSCFAGTNHLFIVPAGREYRICHPVEGDRSLAIFPGRAVSEQFAAIGDTQVRIASAKARVAAFRLVNACRGGADPFTLDELAVSFCTAISECSPVEGMSSAISHQTTLSRAKEFLHAHYREPINLAATARTVGVSAPYLTQLFRRAAGIPLHQYLTQLRLSEALQQIPTSSDLTTLALDLGFSSHSHFTAAFRAGLATTPSALRRTASIEGEGCTPVSERPLCVARGGEPVDC